MKESASYKDAQLSALVGQLKKAGMTPDFAAVRQARGRSPGETFSESQIQVSCFSWVLQLW